MYARCWANEPVPGGPISSVATTDMQELREAFRAGRAPIEKKLAVATGTAGLDPADQAEFLVLLSKDADDRVASRAANSSLNVPAEAFVAALARPDAPALLVDYCAENLVTKPEIARALIAHPACSVNALAKAVHHLPPEEVVLLAENLELLAERPGLAAVLLSSSAIGPEHRRILQEIGQGAVDPEVLACAVKDVDPGQRDTLLKRLAKMRVLERMNLALKGGREERIMLIRDPCKVVQRAVLQSPKLTEKEVETFSSLTTLSEEVLRIIAVTRSFRKNYIIIRNLANNPKTPLDIALRLLPHLRTPDLRLLGGNRNVADTLRSMAWKMHGQRSENR
jgi:hypothetical protein